MFSRKLFIFTLLLSCAGFFVSASTVLTADPANVSTTIVTLDNPLPTTDVRVILGDIIAKALGLLGSLTLLVFMYGGFMWLTAAGNAEHVKKGTQAMVWAIVGLFIVFGSYGIMKLVFGAIGASGDAGKPWGYESFGGTIDKTTKVLCLPKETLNFENECMLASDEAECKTENEKYSSEVCEFKDSSCIQKKTPAEYCKQFDGDPSSCESVSSGACEAAK